MYSVRDTARIRDISDKSITSELPDVDSPQGLEDCAELMYRKVCAHLDRTVPVPAVKHRDGNPGRHWRGRMRLEIMFELWPRLKDTVVVSEEQRNYICGKLFDYLRDSAVMVCVQKTSKFNPAVWWVSNHWMPLQTRSIAQEALMKNSEGTFACRDKDCTVELPTPQGRSGHEFNTHRMVVDGHGKIFYLDDPEYTPEHIVSVFLSVLGDAEKPLTMSGLCNKIANQDPRINASVVKQMLDIFLARNAVRMVSKGKWTAYELVGEGENTVTEEEEELDIMVAEAEPVEILAAKPMLENLGVALATLRSGMVEVVQAVHGSMRIVNAVTEEVQRLEERLAKAEQELAASKMRAMSAPSGGRKVEELEAQLAEVSAERDRYAHRLKTLQQALMGEPGEF